MRWFSPAWDDSDPAPRQAVIDDYYGRHLPTLSARMSPALRRLSCELDLHDGQFASWEQAEDVVGARLLIGDLQVGYQWLTLRYTGAEVEPRDVAPLRLLGADVEVLHDEVDRRQGRWEHRCLLWPVGELALRFTEVELETTPASPADRR